MSTVDSEVYDKNWDDLSGLKDVQEIKDSQEITIDFPDPVAIKKELKEREPFGWRDFLAWGPLIFIVLSLLVTIVTPLLQYEATPKWLLYWFGGIQLVCAAIVAYLTYGFVGARVYDNFSVDGDDLLVFIIGTVGIISMVLMGVGAFGAVDWTRRLFIEVSNVGYLAWFFVGAVVFCFFWLMYLDVDYGY